MHGGMRPTVATDHTVIARGASTPPPSPISTDRQRTSSVAATLVLVFATVALTLGLGLMVASLSLPMEGTGHHASVLLFFGDNHVVPGTMSTHTAGHTPTQSIAMSPGLSHAPTQRQFSPSSTTGPWRSPLYPQNGVTLWDRIRVASQVDRRAFLLGTAIQLHAPMTAATPGARP
jgi:hypothetical protein